MMKIELSKSVQFPSVDTHLYNVSEYIPSTLSILPRRSHQLDVPRFLLLSTMRLLNIILFGLATAVLAVTRCGTRPASDRLRALHAAHAAEEAISTRIAPRAMVKAIKIIVNTYVHVISTGDTADQGNLDDLTVIKQVCE